MPVIGTFCDLAISIADDAGSPHTATLALFAGEASVEGITADGRVVSAFQSQGAYVGLRKGERQPITLTVTGHLARPIDDFRELALGETSGFVSTTADLGDVATVDLTLTLTHSGDVRTIVMEDAHLEGSISIGEGNQFSATFTCYGTFSMTKASGTVVTIHSGR